MPYSIAIGIAQISPKQAFIDELECTCHEAYKACMPPFVFSVPGQVNFRSALHHLLECNKKTCISLRKKVRESMQDKLRWLFQEEALLGCVLVQPLIYKSSRVVNLNQGQHFRAVAHHLAQCPQEACARLRRAVLLTVRDSVSPNAQAKTFDLH